MKRIKKCSFCGACDLANRRRHVVEYLAIVSRYFLRLLRSVNSPLCFKLFLNLLFVFPIITHAPSCIVRSLQVNSSTPFRLHDAVYLYLLVLNQIVAEGYGHRYKDGRFIRNRSVGQQFVGGYNNCTTHLFPPSTALNIHLYTKF